MANRPTQLTRFTVILLLVLLSLSFVTGLGLWYVHEQREKISENPQIGLPRWTSLCQTTHGLLNPAISAVFGFLWFAHVRGGWKMRANRKSGGSMTALMIILIVTGFVAELSPNDLTQLRAANQCAGKTNAMSSPASRCNVNQKWRRESS